MTYKIVIIDDDPTCCEVVSACLATHGLALTVFSDYSKPDEDALRELDEVAVILLDIKLPSANGIEVCKTLRRQLKNNPCIIFISGFDSIEHKVEAFKSGGDDFIEKPFNLDLLAEKVKCGIGMYESRKDIERDFTQLKQSMFQTMMQSSELGDILRFVSETADAVSLEEVAKMLFVMLEKSGLSGCIGIFYGDTVEFYVSDGYCRPLEREILVQCREAGRIYDFDKRTIVNGENCALLIRNMPTDDPDRYGMLRDNICLVIRSVDSRINQLFVEKQLEQADNRINVSINVIKSLLMELDEVALNFAKESAACLENLIVTMDAEFMRLNITEDEEERVSGYLSSCSEAINKLFEDNRKEEENARKILASLTSTLAHQR